MITPERLGELLEKIPDQSIALVGDLFLDRYLHIQPGTSEISIETRLEAYQVSTVRNTPGVLGTVMNNLAALGVGRLAPVSVIGQDGHGDDLLRALAPLPVDTSRIVRDPARLTPTYTKPLAQAPEGAWRELNRLDFRTRAPLDEETIARLIDHLCDVVGQCDALVVSDQIVEDDWGVVNRSVREALVELSRDAEEKLIFIDSRAHIGEFRCGLLKPNVAECLAATGDANAESADDDSDEEARRAALGLFRKTGRPVFCTRGARGMLVVEDDGTVTSVAGYPAGGPIDIVGAGDSATAGVVTALVAGATPTESAAVGNLVASITVAQIGGTGTATAAQVLERVRQGGK